MLAVLAITAVVALGAAAAAAATASNGDPDKGRIIFRLYCGACHGSAGKGDGPGVGTLNPKPRDMTDAVYMRKLDDQYLHEVIAEGGTARDKSPAMPPWSPPLKDGDILDVIAYIRSMAR